MQIRETIEFKWAVYHFLLEAIERCPQTLVEMRKPFGKAVWPVNLSVK